MKNIEKDVLKSLCIFACFVFLTTGIIGCDHDHAEEEDPGEHACEHVDVSPESIDASAARDENAPLIEISGEPYQVTLPDSAAGYVRVEITEDTEALAFTQNENVLADLYHEDTAEGVTSSGANGFCETEIQDHFHLDFHEAGTYYLELGPTASNQAWILLISSEGHEH